ncbi:MAG: hypothetical protein AB1716_25720, partial [Planctomycetota bacterium]
PDGPQDHLHWFDRAIALAPGSGLAYASRAAARLDLAGRSSAASADALRAAARADLEQAEQLGSDEPRVLLLLAEQWQTLGEYARAAARLDAARKLNAEHVAEFILDPADWTTALFIESAKLALLTGAADDGRQLATKTLKELKGTPQETRILPIAIELFVHAGDVRTARDHLDAYLAAIRPLRSPPIGEEQLALIQAIVAAAEDQPYRVIELLEPVVKRAGAAAPLRRLLADAYTRTGQTGRAYALFDEQSARTADAATARQIARACLAQQDWPRAVAALSGSGAPAADDADGRLMLATARLGAALAARGAPEELAKALDELKALRAAFPDRADVRVLLAAAADAQGRRAEAESELRQAIADCAAPLPAILQLARLFATTDRGDEAAELLHGACKDHGASAGPWL